MEKVKSVFWSVKDGLADAYRRRPLVKWATIVTMVLIVVATALRFILPVVL